MLYPKTNNHQKDQAGGLLFFWDAYDHHPFDRGPIWVSLFCAAMFGMGGGMIALDPKWGWVSAMAFFMVAAIYFWTHRNGPELHTIELFENGILVDKSHFYTWNRFQGFWLLQDNLSRVVHLRFNENRKVHLPIQMGEIHEDEIRAAFEYFQLMELKNQKECLFDLWARALRL